MPGISNRLAGICLFSLSIVIVHQSGHAQTAAQNRIVQPIVAAQVSPLQGTVHPLARPQYDHGSGCQFDAITAVLTAQQTPSSSSYHQWLTAAQFGEQFGMSPGYRLASVPGFTVNNVAGSRTSIRFSGTAGMAEQAFHTQIHKYIVNGETHFANATQISLPSAFA